MYSTLNNISSYNTTDPFAPFVPPVSLFCGFSIILISLIGLLGNALSLAVYLQIHFRRLSINVLLAALSMADLGLLLFAMPVCTVGPLASIYKSWKMLDWLDNLVALYLYPLASICRCCSVWLLIAVTIERWLAVCKPLFVTVYCTRDRAMVVAVCILIGSILYNVVRFWEFTGSEQGAIALALRGEKTYVVGYLTLGNLSLFYAIPFVVLLFFNARVVIRIAQSKAERKNLTILQRNDHRTTRMLLYVVLCFLCCYTPSLILDIIEALQPQFLRTSLGAILVNISNVFAISNFATTFFFYLKFSSRYRRTAMLLIARRFRPSIYQHLVVAGDNQLRLYSLIATSPSIQPSRNTRSAESFRRRKRTGGGSQRAADVIERKLSPSLNRSSSAPAAAGDGRRKHPVARFEKIDSGISLRVNFPVEEKTLWRRIVSRKNYPTEL